MELERIDGWMGIGINGCDEVGAVLSRRMHYVAGGVHIDTDRCEGIVVNWDIFIHGTSLLAELLILTF